MNTPGYLQVNRVPHFIKLPYLIYKWLFVVPFLALTTCIAGASIVIASAFGAADFASRVFARTWARVNSRAAFIEVALTGQENFDPSTSYVIVANHQSLVDIYALFGYLEADIKWVLKKELRAIPIFGKAAEVMGNIIIDRSDSKAAIAAINAARERLHGGMSIVFFPEGTRSKPGELRTFKKGAFRLAQELGLPILPIALHGAANILPTHSLELLPGKLKMEICPPIPTEGLATGDVSELTRQTREAINQALMRG